MSKKRSISLAILVGITVLVIFFTKQTETNEPIPSPTTSILENPSFSSHQLVKPVPTDEPIKGGLATTSAPADSFAVRIQQIASLAGTEVNGQIKEDQHGNLIHDRDLRRFFDYFLSLRGRYSSEFIQDLFRSAIRGRLGMQAEEQALILLQKYQSYLDDSVSQLSELEVHANETDFEYLVNQRQNLRRSYLGDDVTEAFYHDTERYEEHQLTALRIGTDSSLSMDEKKLLLEENDAALPAHLSRYRQETFAYTKLESDLNKIQDTAEIYDVVAARFGDEPAKRYMEALQAEKIWKQKVQEYFEAKNAFMNSYGMPSQQAITEWQHHASKFYSTTDLVRLQAIESEIPPPY